MGVEFDIMEFLARAHGMKPPFTCPIDSCRKVYKSHQGIQSHIYKEHQQSTKGDSAGRDRSASPLPSDNGLAREALTYAEAQRIIEIDMDGRLHRININEPMNIVCVEGKNGLTLESQQKPIESSACDSSSSTAKDKGGNSKRGGKDVDAGKKGKAKAKTPKNGKRGGKSERAKTVLPMPSPPPPVIKLPEPSFRLINDYDPPDAAARPPGYYRFIEKSPEELDESVEYDMDEEDFAWLELINKNRRKNRQTEVPADTFELLMDRLEKESYFLSQNSGKDMAPAIDEDAVCCICMDGECQNSNAILFCDMCNLAVHQECYGVPYIPEGQWLCRRCLNSPSSAVNCVLCPNRGGAFKQTDTGDWAHVVCALWIPEVCFANTVFLEPIDSINNIPTARWKLKCYICKNGNNGACIQCHKQNCYDAFHVTCAQQAGLFMKMEPVREMTPTGYQNFVRKAAYCHKHTPANESGTSLSGVYASGEDDEDSRSSHKKRRDIHNDAELDMKIKKARKLIKEKWDATPTVSIPTIPPERLTKIAAKITFPKRNEFILRLLGYWQLKRQSRNGVPLLRRLQISYGSSRRDDSQVDDDEQTTKMKDDLKFLQRLRQDLERARLLVEQIRKREKLKKEQLRYHQMVVEYQLEPFKIFARNVISQLEAKDKDQFFKEPVKTEEVPDYYDFIKNPMDFQTIREKLARNEYHSIKEIEADVQLIISNCKEYNDPDTVFHKAAIKLDNSAKVILKEAALKADKLGYSKAGLHDPPTSMEAHRTNTMNEVRDEEKKLRERLQELHNDLARVRKCKSGGSRSKKIKQLTLQISNCQRDISLLNPTMFSDMDMDELPSNLNLLPVAVQAVTAAASLKRQTQQQSQRSPLKGGLNGMPRSPDSENTDIASETTSPIKLPAEGRKTMNSVSAAIEDSLSPSKKSNDSTKKQRSRKTIAQQPAASTSKAVPKRKAQQMQASSSKKKNAATNEKSKAETAKGTRKRNASSSSPKRVRNKKAHPEDSSDDDERISKAASKATVRGANIISEAANSIPIIGKKGAKKKAKNAKGSKKFSAEPINPHSDSFRVYRSNANSSSDDEDENDSENSEAKSESDSNSDATSTSSNTGSKSDSESDSEDSTNESSEDSDSDEEESEPEPERKKSKRN